MTNLDKIEDAELALRQVLECLHLFREDVFDGNLNLTPNMWQTSALLQRLPLYDSMSSLLEWGIQKAHALLAGVLDAHYASHASVPPPLFFRRPKTRRQGRW